MNPGMARTPGIQALRAHEVAGVGITRCYVTARGTISNLVALAGRVALQDRALHTARQPRWADRQYGEEGK